MDFRSCNYLKSSEKKNLTKTFISFSSVQFHLEFHHWSWPPVETHHANRILITVGDPQDSELFGFYPVDFWITLAFIWSTFQASCMCFVKSQRVCRGPGDGDSHAPTCTRGRSSFANKRIERAGNQQTERAWDVTLYPRGNNTNTASHVNFLLPFIWRLWWKSFIAHKSALVLRPAGNAGKSWKSSCLLFFRSGSVEQLLSNCLFSVYGERQRYNQDRMLVCDKASAPEHKMRT